MHDLTPTQIDIARAIEQADYIKEQTEQGHSSAFAVELWNTTPIDIAPVTFPNGDKGIVFRYRQEEGCPGAWFYAYRKFSTDYSLQFITVNEEDVLSTHGEYSPLPNHHANS